MDHDFLDGIDEHFERLLRDSGSRVGVDGRSRKTDGTASEPTVTDIMAAVELLSESEKSEVLEFVRVLRRKSKLF